MQMKLCPFIESQHSIPKLTHTGVLFPFFTPFTVTDSTLNNKLPQQQTNLPFHVTTGNPIKIAFQQHTLVLQANTKPELETIDLLNLNDEELRILEENFVPVPWENIVNYISWSVGGTFGILLIPFLFCICKYNKKFKNVNTPHNRRKSVHLKLNPLIFVLF